MNQNTQETINMPLSEMTTKQKKANAEFFENQFKICGIYLWKEGGHIFTKDGNKWRASSQTAVNDIADITPNGWIKKWIKSPTPAPAPTDERWCNGESCCKRQLMNGMSWHKRLGFSTACKCAYTMADMEEWEKVAEAVKTQQPDNPLGANLTYEKYVIIKRENPGVLEGLKKQLNLE